MLKETIEHYLSRLLVLIAELAANFQVMRNDTQLLRKIGCVNDL